MRAGWALLIASLAAPLAAGEPSLIQPIDCTLGKTCHIQNYVDRDPGPGAADYDCGTLTYDGHKGTDFALPSLAAMQRGVDVLAAAPGTVLGTRDGMADVAYTDETAGAIAGRECGNGVVLRHAGGYETQYCHMKSGSVRVREGDRVAAGDRLGQVGLSGKTEFPHLHLSVRRDGTVIDPFAVEAGESCGGTGSSLWTATPDYRPGGLIDAGFAAAIPDYDAVKAGTAARANLAPDAPGLVLFGYGYGARTGDVIEIAIDGPDGWTFVDSSGIERNQAQYLKAMGKRLTAGAWPSGTYVGTVTLRRGGAVIDRKTAQMQIR